MGEWQCTCGRVLPMSQSTCSDCGGRIDDDDRPAEERALTDAEVAEIKAQDKLDLLRGK